MRLKNLPERIVRKIKRDFLPPPLEREIPPLKINYNQGYVRDRRDYIRKFKDDSCLRELPFLMKLGLTPGSTLLDYGCGFARLGYAASRYLSAAGAYYGYEPNPAALSFIKQAYADRPNFHFDGKPLPQAEDYIAVRYDEAREGVTSAEQVDLSFVDRPIDVEWSCSVFTHMWGNAIVNTLKAVNEKLSAGGLCVNTWLCIDDYAAYILRCGLADRVLPHRINGVWTTYAENPLGVTAYELADVKAIYERAGHKIEEIIWGAWSGRDNGIVPQDIIISRRIG